MIKREDVYRIGRIGKPHGISGEVSFLFDDDVFDRTDADYIVLDIDGILVPFFIEEYRFKGSETAILKLCDTDTQEQARNLTGCKVFFPRDIAESDQDGASWAEIVGYTLVDAASGKAEGTITDVDDSTLNILFTIHTDDGRDILVPASADLIVSVDKDSHRLAMTLPDGLLDL